MRVVTASVVCTILLAVPALAAAQAAAPSGRPFRGLFGGSNPDSRQAGGLDLNASIQVVRDDDLTGRTGTTPGSATQPVVGGVSSQATVGLGYNRIGETLTIAANAQTGSNYFPDLPELFGVDYSGNVAMTVRRGTFQLAATQSAGRSPFYSFSLAPLAPDAPVGEIDLVREVQVTRRDSTSYRSGLSLSQQITRRTTMALSASWSQTKDRTTDRDLQQLSGSLQLSQKVTQYLALVAGYGHRVADYSASNQFVSQDIMAGVDYDRPLSRTRRTFVSFSSGASILEDQRRAQRNLQVTGSAGLRHMIGRTWTTALNYDRGARYVDGLDAPVISDNVTASLTGFISRRIDATLSAGYASGTVGFSADGRSFDHYFGIATVRYALTRLTALQVQYLQYHYAFDEAPTASLPRDFDRHGVRVALRFWLPLIR